MAGYKKPKAAIKVDMLSYGKIPPQAKELEEVVLGVCMLESGAYEIASGLLKPECFYVDAHQKIFEAMVSLEKKRLPIDLLTVVDELKNLEMLDYVGGPYAVTKLTTSVISSANIEGWCKIIADKFISRELIRVSAEILHECYDDGILGVDLRDRAEAKVMAINTSKKLSYDRLKNAVTGVMDHIINLMHSDSELTGINTGSPALNRLTCGWQADDLIILAARPSVGKTAFALNIARAAAIDFMTKARETGEPVKSVAFFSLEMSKTKIVERQLSIESEIPLEKIMRGKMEEHEYLALQAKGADKIGVMPILIDDTTALNIFELRAKARRMRKDDNLGMIILDYLQLMSGDDDSQREQVISKISRDLKSLAKELKIPIIALSQLSREVEKRGGAKGGSYEPKLSDLRESGAIEQDADMVMFLYRPEYHGEMVDDKDNKIPKGETRVKIAKHRNGALDTIRLKAMLNIQKFVDLDEHEEQKEKMGAGNWKAVQTEATFEKKPEKSVSLDDEDWNKKFAIDENG